jgi:hypothetical protein
MVQDPSTVWMVHKSTGQQGVRGQLQLEADRLIFRPELAGTTPDLLGETVFAGPDIYKVGRSRHSPVLELRVSTPGVPEVVLFYFVKPPDRYSSGLPNPRTAVAAYLTSSNAVYSEEVDDWVWAIRATSGRNRRTEA